MNAQSQDTVTFLLSTLVTLMVLGGLLTRYVLIPYLRDHLIAPVKATERQVTANGHVDEDQPTLPDQLSTIHYEQRKLSRVLARHVAWSIREHKRIDQELEQREAERAHD